LPPAILRRKKMGFDIPAHEWIRGPLRGLVSESLQAGLAAYPDLFRPAIIQGYLQEHLERRINVGYHLWGLMILFLWMRRWGIQAPAARSWVERQPVAAGLLS